MSKEILNTTVKDDYYPDRMFLSRIPQDWTQEIIINKARECGRVVFHHWLRDKKSIILQFENSRACANAIAMFKCLDLSASLARRESTARPVIVPQGDSDGEIYEEPTVKLPNVADLNPISAVIKEALLTDQGTLLKPIVQSNAEGRTNIYGSSCSHCRKNTKNVCKKCELCFCNSRCLYEFRLDHQDICDYVGPEDYDEDIYSALLIPIEEAVNIEKYQINALTLEQRFPPRGHVVISHVHDSQEVSLISMKLDCIEAYALLDDLITLAGNEQKLEILPEIGTIVVACCPEDGNCYRARVLDQIKKKVLVRFIDYGKICTLSLDNLWHLPDQLRKCLPDGAIQVRLKNVPDFATHFPHELLKYKAWNKPLQLVYDGQLDKAVELYDGNRLLNKFPNFDDIVNFSVEPLTYFPDLDQKKVPLGEGTVHLLISHVDAYDLKENGTFWAMNVKSPTIAYIRGDLFSYIQLFVKKCEKTSGYRPVKDESCFAFYDGGWYRVVCENCDDFRCMVFFLIDLGKLITVDSNLVLPRSSWCDKFPPAATPCTLQGFEMIDKDNIETVLTALTESKVVIGNVGGNHSVHIPVLDEIIPQ